MHTFRYQLLGWVLFVVCAVFYIGSSAKNGDTLALTGSVVFLVACLVFIVALVTETKNRR